MPRIPDNIREAIADDLRNKRGGQRVIARRHGVAAGTVRNIADEQGIRDAFDRTAVQNAVTARNVDIQKRRAALAEALIDDAFKLRDRAWATHRYYERGVDGPVLVELELPPAGDVRNFYTAVAICVDKVDRLTAASGREDAANSVDAFLRGMVSGQVADAINQHP